MKNRKSGEWRIRRVKNDNWRRRNSFKSHLNRLEFCYHKQRLGFDLFSFYLASKLFQILRLFKCRVTVLSLKTPEQSSSTVIWWVETNQNPEFVCKAIFTFLSQFSHLFATRWQFNFSFAKLERKDWHKQPRTKQKAKEKKTVARKTFLDKRK